MTAHGALIGCGFFAENHLHAWSQLNGAEMVAICDLDEARLSMVGDRFGISRRYNDAAAMLREGGFDFVDIATTAPSHRTLVELAAGKVGTIICQKPFAESLSDAAAMVKAAAERDSTLIVHENFRWQRPFVAMKTMVEEGRIGIPRYGRFSFRHGYDNYANQPYLAQIERFTIMDVGLHLFDLARLFFGEATDLSCSTQHLNPIVRGEDAFTALLRHEGGASCVCDVSFQSHYQPEPFPNTAALIEGDAGTLELDRHFGLRIHDASGVEEQNLEPDVPPWGARPWHGIQDSVLSFQRHALEVMQGRITPQPSGADNLNTLKLALAAYDAAEQNRTIDMTAWREAA